MENFKNELFATQVSMFILFIICFVMIDYQNERTDRTRELIDMLQKVDVAIVKTDSIQNEKIIELYQNQSIIVFDKDYIVDE